MLLFFDSRITVSTGKKYWLSTHIRTSLFKKRWGMLEEMVDASSEGIVSESLLQSEHNQSWAKNGHTSVCEWLFCFWADFYVSVFFLFGSEFFNNWFYRSFFPFKTLNDLSSRRPLNIHILLKKTLPWKHDAKIRVFDDVRNRLHKILHFILHFIGLLTRIAVSVCHLSKLFPSW